MSRIQSNAPRFSEDQISHATSDPGVGQWVEFPYGKHPGSQEPISNGQTYGSTTTMMRLKIYGRCFKKHN